MYLYICIYFQTCLLCAIGANRCLVFPKFIKLLLDTKTKIKEKPCGRVWLCAKISTCIEFFTGPLKTKHFVKLPYLWDTILLWPFLTDSTCSDIQIQVAPFTIYTFYYLIDHHRRMMCFQELFPSNPTLQDRLSKSFVYIAGYRTS